MANDLQIQQLNIQKQLLLTTESASLPEPQNAVTVLEQTDSSASLPVERKKKFRLPRIVLQDKRRPDFDVKSCVEIDPKIPENDTELPEGDVQSRPPCELRDEKGSKYIVERSDWTPLMKAGPGDIACFLGGCPPGACDKHGRQQRSAAPRARGYDGNNTSDRSSPKESGSSITSGSDAFPHATNSKDLLNGKQPLSTSIVTNFTLGGVKVKSKSPTKRRSVTRSQGADWNVDVPETLRFGQNRGNRPGSIARAREGIERRSKSEGPSSSRPSRTGEDIRLDNTPTITDKDLAPKPEPVTKEQPKITQIIAKGRLRSMKDETRSTQPREFFTSNATKTDDTAPTEVSSFNNRDVLVAFPGAVRIRTNDSQQYPPKPQADSPSGSKPKSFVSSRSKAILAKHELLLPSITESQPLDKGLPLPPILNQTPAVLEAAKSDSPKSAETLKIISDSALEKAIANKIDDSPEDLSPTSISKSGIDEAASIVARPVRLDSPPPSLVASKKNSAAPAVESKAQGAPQDNMYPVDPTAEASLNAVYWGFVPAIKEAVQDVVEVAVRNAVSEANAAAAKKEEASKSVPEPLKVPAQEVSRPSIRDLVPKSQRGSESTIIRTFPANKLDPNTGEVATQVAIESFDAQKIPSPPKGSPRESVASKGRENENKPTSAKASLAVPNTAFDQLETVPLDDSKPVDRKSESAPVPPRRSSKNKAAASKRESLSAQVEISPKTSVAPQQSPSRRATRALRSISGSSEMDSKAKDADADAKAPLMEELDDETTYPGNKLSRANTVQWLKGLVSSNEFYETQFTALPSQTRKDKAMLKANIKSGKQAEKTGAAEFKTLPLGPVITKPKTAASKRDKKADASEAFTQTINDLETLMNEALQIARQAADTRDAPNALGNAAKTLRSDREKSEEAMRACYQAARREDRESLASVHESVMSYSDSEISDMTEDDNDYRHPRPPTPPVFDIPAEEKPASNNKSSVDNIKSADPRSLPLESQINDDNKKKPSLAPESQMPAVGPRSSSNREPLIANSEIYSESDYGERPEFKLPEFSRARAATMKTLDSEKSPRRLSPAKSSTLLMDKSEQEAAVGLLDESGDPQEEEFSGPLPQLTPKNMSSRRCNKGHSAEDYETVAAKLASKSVPGKRQVRDYILEHHQPPIQERESSRNLRQMAKLHQGSPRVLTGQTVLSGSTDKTGKTYDWQNIDQSKVEPCPDMEPRVPSVPAENIRPSPRYAPSYDGSNMTHEMDFETGYGVRQRGGGGEAAKNQNGYELRDTPGANLPQTSRSGPSGPKGSHSFNLRGLNHMSLKDHHLKGFSLARSAKKQKIARDWSPARKRFVAFVSCLSTALVGLLVGIYAGATPSIQYYIVDLHHYTVLGNVFFFIGLSIPTFFFWPLPLLHGRKPYILGSMSLAMPLLFPQALAVGQIRSPYVATWRVALILPRAAMGFCLGFANMNFKSMLTDVFGASLQSSNPHQEHADEFDVRRHGGGMGVWLGLWTWSALGSIGVGFMIGAMIINTLSPAWAFYICITIIAFVMLLNVLVPETRRSAYRRSVAEVPNGNGDVSRRLARGEVKMHMVQTGPKWWGEEFHYGVMLTLKMLRQPGFMVMSLYIAWIYGQMVMIILLLGALMSRDYHFTSPQVAASATAIPLGAMLAIPFQKASLLSRARSKSPVSDDHTTSHNKVHWSSHMVRRSIFIIALPLAGIGYTAASKGPPVPFIIPILFAGLIGFLSNLAMAECHGILMETFDTSDLQPGMTGRARGSSGDKKEAKRTNYSSFPRVQSAFAITQGFGYLIASIATGVGGAMTRDIGAQAATGVMAGILFILSLMLLGVLVRFTTVQIVPDHQVEEMEQYHGAMNARKEAGNANDEEEPFRPIIIGNPHHHTRRMCLLELGGLSRFSEIRIKNKLVDNNSLEAKHPNRAAFQVFEKKIKEKEEEVVHHVRRSLSRASSRGSRRSDVPIAIPEAEQVPGDLGGFREMGVETSAGATANTLARNRSGKGSGNVRGSRKDQLRRAESSTRRRNDQISE